jgi:hypothetical protein
MFQKWRNPEEVVWTILMYLLFAIKVLVFCWLGSELSSQESISVNK